MDLNQDFLQQSVPAGLLQMQPVLGMLETPPSQRVYLIENSTERCLRDVVIGSEFCELRRGCEVERLIENATGVEVQYKTSDEPTNKLQTTWLVGADGKRGVVRKTFLEKVADVRQVSTDYQYTGTWVAANIHINLPTPKTHPDFPPFASGLSPQEAYDLFWPQGWHFCAPPGKPTAAGRLGPHEQRLWRHEFAQENVNEDSLNAEVLLWEHLTPMITRTADAKGNKFSREAVWPKDTIEILRCRPFTFTHKVVNRWSWKRTVLIGDAAHVFPPFGGQGIASGVRDAHQLAWRIALLESQPQCADHQVDRILNAWAAERTQSIKDAAFFTSINARMCNERLPKLISALKAFEWVRKHVLGYTERSDPQASIERLGFSKVAQGFHLPEHRGGIKLPQVYLDSLYESKLLSDSIYEPTDSLLRLLVVVDGQEQTHSIQKSYEATLKDLAIPERLLSSASTFIVSRVSAAPQSIEAPSGTPVKKFYPTPTQSLSHSQARQGYDPSAIQSRFGKNVQYIIVRPDFFAFAAATDIAELETCLKGLKSWL